MFRFSAKIRKVPGGRNPEHDDISLSVNTTLSVVAKNATEADAKARAFLCDTTDDKSYFIEWTDFAEIVRCGGQFGNCPCNRTADEDEAPAGCCIN